MTNLEALIIEQRVTSRLLCIQQALDRSLLENPNMAVDPKVAELITKFDNATDAIAARIQRMIDAGGLNPESQAALQAEVDKLNLLGQDPANPVPSEG